MRVTHLLLPACHARSSTVHVQGIAASSDMRPTAPADAALHLLMPHGSCWLQVSSTIIAAKEDAEREKQAREQSSMQPTYGPLSVSQPTAVLMQPGYQQRQQVLVPVLTADCQQQLVVVNAHRVANAAPAVFHGDDNLQQQQQQLPSALPVGGSSYVLMPATATDTMSSRSCIDRTLIASSSSTASSYMLCSEPADQTALLPAPSPAAWCNSSSSGYAASMLMPKQQLEPQQPQPQLMMASAPGQHLQLSAQVTMSMAAPQLSVSAAASADSHLLPVPCGLQQQVLPAPLPQELSMLGATANCCLDYNVPQRWQAAGQQLLVDGSDMTAAAVSGLCMPHTVLAGPVAAEAVGGSGPLCGTDSMALVQLHAAAMAPACLAGDAGQGYGRLLHDCSSYQHSSMATAVSAQATGT
jgi:hypothetical protein